MRVGGSIGGQGIGRLGKVGGVSRAREGIKTSCVLILSISNAGKVKPLKETQF